MNTVPIVLPLAGRGAIRFCGAREEVRGDMPNRRNGLPQIQAGGCVVLFTTANGNAIDDVAAELAQAEDIDSVIAQLTARRDEIQERAYARLGMQRAMNAEMHERVVRLPAELSRNFRVTGFGTPVNPTTADVAAAVARQKESRALSGQAPSAA